MTEAIRRAIQHSQASLKTLAERHGINPKTVTKWRKRDTTAHRLRQHTPLPLDDCLYALQVTVPHLTRSPLYCCLQRHSISRLPEMTSDKPAEKRFKAYPNCTKK
jgi:transposase-like protein